MARRLIGSGTTDSNGRISVSYTGKGAGKIQLVAVNGSLSSETYELIDALYYDAMTSDTTSRYSTINASLTFSTDNIILTRTSDGECVMNYYVPNGSLNNYIGQTVHFEFEVVEVTPNCMARIFQYKNGAWQPTSGQSTTSGNVATVDATIDNAATNVIFRVSANDIGTNGTCSFRNFKVYPI